MKEGYEGLVVSLSMLVIVFLFIAIAKFLL
jgi:hypothetical protein